MRPTQRKHFYAQKFNSRFGPFTKTLNHLRQPKPALQYQTQAYQVQGYQAQGYQSKQQFQAPGYQAHSYGKKPVRKPVIQPEFAAVPRISAKWEEDEPLSAATFRARALERAMRGDEPTNSLAPENPRRRAVTLPKPSKQEVKAAPIDVNISNSVLTTQTRRDQYPKAKYLESESGEPDQYSDGTLIFTANEAICATELVFEVSGQLSPFDKYLDSPTGECQINVYVGAHAVLGTIRCLADFLMHGKLESYEIGSTQLHLFRMQLAFQEGQGIGMQANSKVRVIISGLELPELSAAEGRHRFFLRYFEEK
jgi:hypothetical protein